MPEKLKPSFGEEVRVRKVSPGTVKRIDELARKAGLKRQEYLRRQLESIGMSSVLKEQEQTFMEVSKDILNAVNDINKQLFELRMLLLGEDVIEEEIK